VPSAWGDVTLHDFRTQGAFLVSAARTGGSAQFVRVRSLAGEPCKLKHSISTTGQSTTTYQAESATLSQAVVATNHLNYSGSGFADYNAVAGSYVEFTVTAAQAGPATLNFRYANGSTANRPMDVRVNGSVVASPAFAPTGNWDTWQTVSITANLNAGNNTIRATATVASGGPNLDRLDVAVGAAGLTVVLDDGTPASWSDLGGGVIAIDLPKNREAFVYATGTTPSLTIAPLSPTVLGEFQCVPRFPGGPRRSRQPSSWPDWWWPYR
jgi:hypothetical protein